MWTTHLLNASVSIHRSVIETSDASGKALKIQRVSEQLPKNGYGRNTR